MSEDNRILRIAFNRLDNELKSYRIKPFLEENYEGIRKYDKNLLNVLKEQKFLKYDEILDRLKIDPNNTDIVKGISNQLENLEGYGLIKKTSKGWRWIE